MYGFVVHVEGGGGGDGGGAGAGYAPDLIEAGFAAGLEFGDAEGTVGVALGFFDVAPVVVLFGLDFGVGEIGLVVFLGFC